MVLSIGVTCTYILYSCMYIPKPQTCTCTTQLHCVLYTGICSAHVFQPSAIPTPLSYVAPRDRTRHPPEHIAWRLRDCASRRAYRAARGRHLRGQRYSDSAHKVSGSRRPRTIRSRGAPHEETAHTAPLQQSTRVRFTTPQPQPLLLLINHVDREGKARGSGRQGSCVHHHHPTSPLIRACSRRVPTRGASTGPVSPTQQPPCR